jgi:hypothetical protein
MVTANTCYNQPLPFRDKNKQAINGIVTQTKWQWEICSSLHFCASLYSTNDILKALVAFIFVWLQPNLISTLLEVDRLAVNTTDLEQLHMIIVQRCPLFVRDIKAIDSSMNNSQ